MLETSLRALPDVEALGKAALATGRLAAGLVTTVVTGQGVKELLKGAKELGALAVNASRRKLAQRGFVEFQLLQKVWRAPRAFSVGVQRTIPPDLTC